MENFKGRIDWDSIVAPHELKVMSIMSGQRYDGRFMAYDGKAYISSEYFAEKLLEGSPKTSNDIVREIPIVYRSIMRQIRLDKNKPLDHVLAENV